MFDDITDPSHQDGVRGFIARHFGPVTHVDVAFDEARDVSTIFLFLASLLAIIIALQSGVLNAPFPIVLAVLAGLLRVSMSRVAASLLLLLAAINAALLFPALGALALLGFAARATQHTFAYHRLKAAEATAVSSSAPLSVADPGSKPGGGA